MTQNRNKVTASATTKPITILDRLPVWVCAKVWLIDTDISAV